MSTLVSKIGIGARILIVQFYQAHGRDFILCCINATSLWASQPSLKDDLADENAHKKYSVPLAPHTAAGQKKESPMAAIISWQ